MFSTIIQAVLKGIALVSGFLPLFSTTQASNSNSTVATVTDDLTKIAAAVQTAGVVVAAIQGAGANPTPAQIVAAAQPLVTQIVHQAEFVTGKKVQNEAQFTAGVQQMTAGLVEVLEALG